MTTLARAIRNHRESARSRRALLQAIDNAWTQSARDDIILAMQRSESTR